MPANSYLLFKLLHLIAVVLFLGNATLGLFWVAHAERTRDVRLIAHAMAGIIRGDRWFTWPGVTLIIAAGIGAAVIGGLGLLHVGWIAWSVVLFGISGTVFAVWLAPLQRRIVELAATPATDAAQIQRLLRRWHAVGWLSLTPLWLAFAAMVMKWPA